MKCDKCEHSASDHYHSGCLGDIDRGANCKCKKFEPSLDSWQALEKVLDKFNL